MCGVTVVCVSLPGKQEVKRADVRRLEAACGRPHARETVRTPKHVSREAVRATRVRMKGEEQVKTPRKEERERESRGQGWGIVGQFEQTNNMSKRIC